MPAQILTTDDLREFKVEMLEEIKKLFQETNGQQTKKWLKSNEVRKLLNISPGTLQNLRINGTLPYTKIGGIIFYSTSDIDQVIKSNMTNHMTKPSTSNFSNP